MAQTIPAWLALATVLTACSGGNVPTSRVKVEPVPVASYEKSESVGDELRALEVWLGTARWNDTVAWNAAVKNAETARRERTREAQRLRSTNASPGVRVSSHSGHSEAWWHGVAICEQGGRNDEFFGYFSYMDGSAGGGMSWADQVAKGNRTIATYGDHAWAAACVAAGYRAAPNG